MLSSRFSFLGIGSSSSEVNDSLGDSGTKIKPSLSVQTDKDVYRPGDFVFVTLEVGYSAVRDHENGASPSVLVDKLSFEVKGVEKLDVQWFSAQKPSPGSKGRRGEHIFLDSSTPSLISNQLLSPGAKMTLMVRAALPQIIPPSYKGATLRYHYYIKSTLSGRLMALENSQFYKDSTKDFIEVETRVPIQVWAIQKNNGLLLEESQTDGIVPTSTIQTEIYWKGMDGDSEWVCHAHSCIILLLIDFTTACTAFCIPTGFICMPVNIKTLNELHLMQTRANDAYDNGEDGYDSSRDEISSVSSYPNKGNLNRAFGSSVSLNSGPRLSLNATSYIEGVGSSPKELVSQLSAAVVSYDSGPDGFSPGKSSNSVIPSQQLKQTNGPGESNSPEAGAGEPIPSERFTRGRSYNIRMDDQVLLRFSPKNADSTYYFSDNIGGTLTFFHEGARRCLEVSVTLETSETINRKFVHPSRRSSPTHTKVQSDHHEVVADLIQTSFLFSIPTDGPMSFTTPRVSVQWILRFEFLITPKDVDLSRYEHPLLVPEREKSEWVLPITVHAPPPRTSSPAQNRGDKLYGLEPSWIRS
uniref:RAB6A-GEF complex partner protein 2 n=1 Tax=Brassica campestris TaxID=3711 RepID=M4DCM2_BRACM